MASTKPPRRCYGSRWTGPSSNSGSWAGRDARDLAVAMIASYEGIALLTNIFREPELMTRQERRLERWIDSLAP
jgi:hypothetical protein